MPCLASLLSRGSFRQLNSVHPTVSSVAWSSYMTGKNPGNHGIFGFVDRRPGSRKLFIPNSRDMQSRTLWELLSEAGKRVIVMNVPVTYPPRPVNGLLVCGFLGPNLDTGTYPPSFADVLRRFDYRIDTSPKRLRESRQAVLDEVNLVFDRRVAAMLHLLDNEDWDFFQCHIMETDRLQHFLWEPMEIGDPTYEPQFMAFFHKVDEMLGEVSRRIGDDTTMIVMSDHGFCSLKKEVYINYWLRDNGWLGLPEDSSVSTLTLEQILPDSRAFCLDPGRIFINLKGREQDGCVTEGADYEAVRSDILAAALELRDSDTGGKLVQRMVRREEIYHGPCTERAADLIWVPMPGYDPKGAFGKQMLTYKGPALVGMHTYDDAMLGISDRQLPEGEMSVMDVMPIILQAMGLPIPGDLDGCCA